MFLRHLDLTTALRPSLYDDEVSVFVQDGVGLYEGKFKIPNYQNGHVYLTSHRLCYVDNEEPRKYSVAVDLKDIDPERTEFYAGFLKSSPKVTLFPKAMKRPDHGIGNSVLKYASPGDTLVSSSTYSPRPTTQSPASARSANATWICPICGLSNPVPPNFDASTANQHTPLPPCQACGIQPSLAHLVKAAIAAMSNRAGGPASGAVLVDSRMDHHTQSGLPVSSRNNASSGNQCPRCTFQNHSSLKSCEMCGAPLQNAGDRRSRITEESLTRPESPGPTLATDTIIGNDSIETIKFSFRVGGALPFYDRLKNTLVQREWLLQSAPPVPRPTHTPPLGSGSSQSTSSMSTPTSAPKRIVGIAGLEQRGAKMRQNNQAVIGSAFEDLEALMTSAKEVIQMAEQFARQSSTGPDADSEARRLISDSASALGLVTTKDMLGSSSSAEQTYITELSRNLAELLTDDRKGVLRKEGGIMSLIDLWQVFNRTRNGIELISPLDFEKAANKWDALHLPIRLRRFKSGLLVVQERNRTDEKTIASVLAWLREPQSTFPPEEHNLDVRNLGRGVTAQEAAGRFGWSIGVATEELELAEETGALCRDQCLDGIRFWENHFLGALAQTTIPT